MTVPRFRILLIAFAPLDYAFAGDAGHLVAATLFFICGVLSFGAGLALEVRKGDAS